MLLDRLKQETRRHHDRIEQLNGLPANLPEYTVQLEGFFGFVAPWEEHVATVLPPDDPVRLGREKTGWLASDLRYFGCDPAALAHLPRCAALPVATTRTQILGVAYVLEGSTLGGQFISRHLEQALGLKDGQGCRYFRSYGPDIGPKWQAFRAELTRASSPEADDLIVRSAQAAFDSLHAWFAARKPVLA
jgi:heme oxygenase